MIPTPTIIEWSRRVPWPSVDQVEQDLLLSRLIVEIANDDYPGNELVFRGGTCLNKLVSPTPLRYSEDLDYVRTTGGGIREFTRAVTDIGDPLWHGHTGHHHLWMPMTQLDVQPEDLVAAFAPCRPDGATRRRAERSVSTERRTLVRRHVEPERDDELGYRAETTRPGLGISAEHGRCPVQ